MTQQQHSMTREEGIQKVAGFIKDIRIAMFTSVAEDGHLHARPMGTQSTEFDGTLWFFTWKNTEKVDEFQGNPNVNVAYSDPNKQTYVSVAGTASLVLDKAKMEELWEPPLKAWFPDGIDDPNIALIRVDVHSAEYWDSPSSKVVHLYGMVKATLTGKPATDIGENETVEFE